MFCQQCGNKLSEDAIFCENCGTKITENYNSQNIETQDNNTNTAEPIIATPDQPPATVQDNNVFCTNCGSIITEGEIFCSNCGQAVQTDENANAAPEMAIENIPPTPAPVTAAENITSATAPIMTAANIPPTPAPIMTEENSNAEPEIATPDQPPATVQEKYVFCINCGAKILEGVKFCGNCGTNTVFGPKPQTNTQQRNDTSAQKMYAAFTNFLDNIGIPKNPSLRWLIIIGAIVVIILIFSGLFSNSNKGTNAVTQTQNYQYTAPSSGGTATAPAPSAPAQSSGGTAAVPQPTEQVELRPKSQIMFDNVILYYSEEFRKANNELQESVLRRERKNAIAALNMGFYVDNWVGTIADFGTNTEGKAYIKIRLSRYLNVKTWSNALSDMFDDTLIEMDSDLFQVLYNLNKGQRVRFSGSLFRADEDFYKETSFTIRGSMTDSDFLMSFTDIKPF